jgi:hypothetical protein
VAPIPAFAQRLSVRRKSADSICGR